MEKIMIIMTVHTDRLLFLEKIMIIVMVHTSRQTAVYVVY